MKNLNPVMVAQTERGNKKLRNAKITVAHGVILIALGFATLAQFEDSASGTVMGAVVLGLGSFGVTLGSESWIKAKSIIESASRGFVKFF